MDVAGFLFVLVLLHRALNAENSDNWLLKKAIFSDSSLEISRASEESASSADTLRKASDSDK